MSFAVHVAATLRRHLGVPETLALLPTISAMNDATGIAGEGSLPHQVATLLAAMSMAVARGQHGVGGGFAVSYPARF